mgnify:CR=1 FL=1
MRIPGDVDPLYALARRVLLDALGAFGDQRNAIILVGAQAIYMHTGDADLAVALFTTDADIAFDPAALLPDPKLEEAMGKAGFVPDPEQIGIWRGEHEGVSVDLLVPAAVGGAGRRGARLGPHGNKAARKVRGLEGALVDNAPTDIEALENGDVRRYTIRVAGPTALLVAKLHKLGERQNEPGRLADKDALDIYRLLRAIPVEVLGNRLRLLLRDPRSAEVTAEAIGYLGSLFGTTTSAGSLMVARAVVPLEDPATVAASSVALSDELLSRLEGAVPDTR